MQHGADGLASAVLDACGSVGRIVVLGELPLTANGKVDRARLPAPTAPTPESRASAAPSGELERRIAAVWSEILGLDEVGVDDNFFDLGGTSFTMVQVQDRLREVLGRNLTVAELFEHTTIRGLAQYAAAEDDSAELVDRGRERAAARRGALAGRRGGRGRR